MQGTLEVFKLQHCGGVSVVEAVYVSASHFSRCPAVLRFRFHCSQTEQDFTEYEHILFVQIKRSKNGCTFHIRRELDSIEQKYEST